MIKEIWKDISGYEGLYQVSNIGRVKSLKRTIKRLEFSMQIKERILNCGLDGDGYKHVSLSKNGYCKTTKIHKLVAMEFLNHKPNGGVKIVIDHINNIKIDNRLENLQLISNRENLTKDRNFGTSSYIGVSRVCSRNKWRSDIYINGKPIYLGLFNNEIDASNAYQNELKIINQ